MSGRYVAYSDEDLLGLMHQHDDELAFGELYHRYFRLLFNYSYEKVNDRFVAQEIVQELFVSLWQQRHRIAIQACRHYLFSVAKNLIISSFRKELTRQRHYHQWSTLHPSTSSPCDQPALTNDLQHHYQKSLNLLPAKCREVFLLSRQGLSNGEIALTLNISEKTVEQHITKALRNLRVHLKEHLLYNPLLFYYLSKYCYLD